LLEHDAMSQLQALRKLPATWRRVVLKEQRSRRIGRRIRRGIRSHLAHTPAVDPATSAGVAGLRHVNDATLPGIRRIGSSSRVRYVDPQGRTVINREVLERIRALAVPPAWRDVWICPHPLGHLQATGRDARGRKQYRYHPTWRQVRDEVKYGRLIAFSEALPEIRRRAASDVGRAGLPREKVVAAVVQLLEKTLIRVGNDEYARDNQSFGLTTLRDKHAVVKGARVRFEFRGKSGIAHAVDLHDARLAAIVKRCRDLPGYELFQYVDAAGRRHAADSADVNQYLRDITGHAFSAKDFRTWAGTVLAARALSDLTPCSQKHAATRRIVRAVETVARRLGNTSAVCRKSYIHPAILEAYMDGETIATLKTRTVGSDRTTARLAADERAVVAMLERRRRMTVNR
jgi:DNA topoisomerase-1